MLWAVTAYFNPLRYRRRLRAYREFRRRLRAPLLAIELGFERRFELNDADADILLRVSDGDVMWQKERLLNLAVAKLPPECTLVACVDCDVIFARSRWHEEAAALAERFPVVQAFADVHYLGEEWRPGDELRPRVELSQRGVASLADPERLGEPRSPGSAGVGFAWIYRRDLLARHGLYDACIVGGGDTAMACAAYGRPELVVQLHTMNPHQERWYRKWAEPFFQSVQARVGALAGDVYHLWHGEFEHRYPRQRHLDLAPFDFDPERDIALAADGCWRWSSDKPGLHAYLRRYFAARREDG